MKLAKKEKTIFNSVIAGLVLLLIYNFAIEPSLTNYHDLELRVIQREVDLNELAQLKDVYLKQEKVLEGINEQISAKEKNFAVLSFLEETATKAGIRSKITNMKPSESNFADLYKESAVELKIEDISLEQLVDYLYHVESNNKLIKIKKIQIKTRNDNAQILDVNCVIATYDLLKKS